MFSKLDGLPLAIAQAGAYLQQSGVGIEKYLEFYEQQWKELMDSEGPSHTPLQEYLNGSVGTTWNISYKAVREKDEAAANLLLLWAFLDNRDLWHGLFVAACRASSLAALRLSELIGNIASTELEFTKAIQVLRNYSLIEDVEDLASYATHPVVHRWAYHSLGEDSRVKLAQLAVVIVGWSVHHESTRHCSAINRRLLRHAQACSRWVSMGEITENIRSHEKDEVDFNRTKEKKTVLNAIHMLGILYADQGKMAEAEKMYQRALEGMEKAWAPEHTSTLDTVNNLGLLYVDQGKMTEAEKMCQRALEGKEKAWGPEHTSTLDTVNNLGLIYANQGKITEAEKMYQRALKGYEKALGPNHMSALNALHTINNLGRLYADQGKHIEAEKMYQRALDGYEKGWGRDNPSTLRTLNHLKLLNASRSEHIKVKEIYSYALDESDKAHKHETASSTATINS